MAKTRTCAATASASTQVERLRLFPCCRFHLQLGFLPTFGSPSLSLTRRRTQLILRARVEGRYGNTAFLSEIGTKLRDWAVGQAGGSCYSQAALSSNDSKTLYVGDIAPQDDHIRCILFCQQLFIFCHSVTFCRLSIPWNNRTKPLTVGPPPFFLPRQLAALINCIRSLSLVSSLR